MQSRSRRRRWWRLRSVRRPARREFRGGGFEIRATAAPVKMASGIALAQGTRLSVVIDDHTGVVTSIVLGSTGPTRAQLAQLGAVHTAATLTYGGQLRRTLKAGPHRTLRRLYGGDEFGLTHRHPERPPPTSRHGPPSAYPVRPRARGRSTLPEGRRRGAARARPDRPRRVGLPPGRARRRISSAEPEPEPGSVGHGHPPVAHGKAPVALGEQSQRGQPARRQRAQRCGGVQRPGDAGRTVEA